MAPVGAQVLQSVSICCDSPLRWSVVGIINASHECANDWIIDIITLQVDMIEFPSVQNQPERKQLFDM